MDKKEMLKSMMSLKSKLMATVSMLLVSAILLTNVSYAWFVLSTAPEVSGVSTTSGANGALEIALQSNETPGSVTRLQNITSGVGDSSSLKNQPIADANITWGNIVDVSTDYGLKDITLYPARLNLGVNNTVNLGNYLSVPQYGTDGRISGFKLSNKVSYSDGAYVTNPNNYGVNVHGFPADAAEQVPIVSNFQRAVVKDEAVKQVEVRRNTLRTSLIDAVEENGFGVIQLIFAVMLESDVYNDVSQETIANLIEEFDEVVTETAVALRWALLANVMADTTRYDPENPDHMIALGEIYRDFLTMDLTGELSANTIQSLAEPYAELEKAISTWKDVREMVDDALLLVDAGNYAVAGLQIIDKNHIFLTLGTQEPLQLYSFEANFETSVVDDQRYEDYLYFVGSTENIASSGFFPAMASILGDYSADMLAYLYPDDMIVFPSYIEGTEEFIFHSRSTCNYGDNPAKPVDGYNEAENKGVLWNVYVEADEANASGIIPMTTTRGDVTAYGYSVDFAFRSSEDGNLALQQEGTSRIANPYDDPNNLNQNLQGAGSTVTFDIYGDMTIDQVKRLLESLYVVFMNSDSGQIYGVGRVKPADVELLGVSVTAPLTLYSVDTEAMNDEDAPEGVLILGEPVKDNVITKLTKDKTAWITAIVYLNGDTVSSADVSAVGQMSLIGSINLQFALDGVDLEAMRYDDYYVAPTESQAAGG